jgi:hypothetical protein
MGKSPATLSNGFDFERFMKGPGVGAERRNQERKGRTITQAEKDCAPTRGALTYDARLIRALHHLLSPGQGQVFRAGRVMSTIRRNFCLSRFSCGELR